MYYHTQTFIPKDRLQWTLHLADHASFTLISHWGLPHFYSHVCYNNWLMFQEGVKKTILLSSRVHRDSPQYIGGQRKYITTPLKRLPSYLPFTPRQILAEWQKATAPKPQVVEDILLTHGTGFLCFPCRKFRYYLTLF